MSRKYFILLGLFLATGFLFLNASTVNATYFWWDGGGDGVTWTDPLNWGNDSNYPGKTVTDQAVIATSTAGGNVTVRATSTLAGSLEYLQLGYNAGGYKSGATLILGKDATIAASSSIILVGTSTLKLGDSTWGSGTIIFATSSLNAIPFKLSTTTADTFFYAATGTVTFTGTGGGIVVATTTYYNLTFTPTSTTALSTYIFDMKSGSSTCFTTNGCTSTTTISNVLTLNASSSVNFNSNAVILSGSGTAFEKANGDFVANGSLVKYTNASVATNVATGTYANLVISGAGVTKTLLGNVTATSTVSIDSGTLALTTSTFTVTGSTYTNSGSVTRTTGKIVKASTSQFDDGTGTAKGSFNGDTPDKVYVRVTDVSLNLLADTIETQSVLITAKSSISDSESVTLTETSASSGIFSGGVTFGLSGTNVGGQLDYQGPGTLTYAFTDSQDSSDTGSGTGNFSGTAGSGGGSGGGGTVTAIVTPAVPATPVTPAVPATPAVPGETPAVPATPATPAAPSLDSVNAKIVSVMAKIATLTKNSPVADIAAVQAEIAAILIDIQAIQLAQQPADSSLGFNFAKPLSFGMTNNDVRNLQTAFKTDPSVYPEGLVTGYFGPATQRAVKKFQEKYGIASAGQPGYGNVGPKTREKLNELY